MANLFNASWLAGRMVTIYVGPTNQPWNVHEKLLIENSPFFARALEALRREQDKVNEQRTDGPAGTPGAYNHGYGPALGSPFGQQSAGLANTPPALIPENKSGCVCLVDVDPKLFNMFLRWGYGTAFALSGNTRSFRFPRPVDSISEGEDPMNVATVRDYLGVYVLGYKFETEALRNACIDVLYDYFGPASDDHYCLKMEDVAFIFANTPEEAPMRRFLVAHLLFYVFSRNRRGVSIPEEWGTVLEKGDFGISWTLVRMLGDWNWAIGSNVPVMIIKPRNEFHDKTPAQLARMRMLAGLPGRAGALGVELGEGGSNPVMIKREESAVVIGGQSSGIGEVATAVDVLQGSEEGRGGSGREDTPGRSTGFGPIRTARRGRMGGSRGDHPTSPYQLD
ncbi:hypothetical protein QBC40DRAFT_336701 [Triangularia verruculosa]|uniref:BTB domain-containing protein n=1 Tax=Triangularia verruculosa TaxID=2587418 RepID=A0AAN7AZ02_9PEZI|nr:hypothetical protein QBC40DRAFT_336701 [Triangularia verruculosa]